MPSRNLTVRFLETVKKPDTRTDFFDTGQPGLVLRVTPRGKKFFTVYGRAKGTTKQFRKTIGYYPALSLSEARQDAAKIMRKASEGINPVEEAKAKRRTIGDTFGALVREYLARHAAKKKTLLEQTRIIEKDLLPAWGDLKATEIRKRDVRRLLDAILERGAPISANRAASLVRAIFNFGIDEEIVETNPAARLKRPGGKEPSRERILSDGEIRDFWHGLDAAAMDHTTRQALRLTLITAQRPGEISGARWDEFDLPRKTWTLPAARAKNEKPHRVPLSKLALEILLTLPRDTEWLFPSRHGGKPITSPDISPIRRRNPL